MERSILCITQEKELKIFMNPLRQRLLRLLTLHEFATAKQLADWLEISPSSAKHHLTQLESIGLVAPHHAQIIRGITATYYQRCPVTVRLGLDQQDVTEQRQLLAENMLMEVYKGFRKFTEFNRLNTPSQCPALFELITGVVHLSHEDAQQLLHIIRTFVEVHEQPRTSTSPYEYALVAYPVENNI